MALSPIDPLNYAMLSTRALADAVRGRYERAITWSDEAIRQPTAHAHIFLIAALVNQLGGQHEAAARHARRVREMDPVYSLDAFFQAFQFRDPATREKFIAALKDLGI